MTRAEGDLEFIQTVRNSFRTETVPSIILRHEKLCLSELTAVVLLNKRKIMCVLRSHSAKQKSGDLNLSSASASLSLSLFICAKMTLN